MNNTTTEYLLQSELDLTSNAECTLISNPKICHQLLFHQKESAKQPLCIICVNIRSVNHNMDLFLAFLSSIKIKMDVIVLTECWTNEKNPPPTIDFYNMAYTKNCLNQNDGVVAYVHREISATFLEPNIRDGNCLIINIDEHYSIVCSYRPPCFRNPSNYINSLEVVFNSIKTPNIIFTGDINIDILSTHDSNNYVQSYLNLMAMYGLIQGINQPTRINTCIDHFMVKSCYFWKTFVFEQALTDHSPIMLYIDRIKNCKTSTIPSKFIINYTTLRHQLSEENWSEIKQLNNVNIAIELFLNRLQKLIDNNTTVRRVPKNKMPLKPWITISVVRSIRKRDKLYKNMKKNPENMDIKKRYTDYRNICNKIIKTLKAKYYQEKLEKNSGNTKETWKIIKDVCNLNINTQNPKELLNIYPDPKDSLNEVNRFFTSVGQNLANVILQKLNLSEKELAQKSKSTNQPRNSFSLFLTDEYEIKSIINSLRTSSAPGWDNITVTTLKKIVSHITVPLTYICNLSFTTGIFPDICKKATICPIYKSGDKCSPTNYRPISLLSVLSKIIEKIVNKRLLTFLENNQLISKNQFGFRRKKSTEDAVLRLTSIIKDHLDMGECCLGVFLDLQKAFDTVSIPILLSRLEASGIRGLPLKWFKSYLSAREQRVRVSNLESEVSYSNFGLPQGTSLSPSLFLIYVNELCKISHQGLDILMFADDTVLLFHDKTWQSVAEVAETGISMITSWLEDSLLSLNVKKTKYVCFSKTSFSSPPHDFRLLIHTYPCNRLITNRPSKCLCLDIERTKTIKYLGITLDANLNWSEHITLLSARVRKLIYIFKNLRNVANIKVLTQTYKALCESITNYCICIWGNAAKTHLISIERAQRAILKVMLYLPFRHPTSDVYIKSKVLSVRKTYIYHVIKRYHSTIVPYLPIATKRVDRCPVPRARCKIAKKHFDRVAPLLYNKLFRINRHIKKKSAYELRKLTHDWLEKMDYDEIENMLDM